jgi:hypothetical protein
LARAETVKGEEAEADEEEGGGGGSGAVTVRTTYWVPGWVPEALALRLRVAVEVPIMRGALP